MVVGVGPAPADVVSADEGDSADEADEFRGGMICRQARWFSSIYSAEGVPKLGLIRDSSF